MKQLGLFDPNAPASEGISKATARQLKALKKIEEHASPVVIGLDEVGFGAWAGPLTIGVAVFQKGWAHPDVKDSKVTQPRERERVLTEILIPNALFFAVLSAPSSDIDAYGAEYTRKALTESAAVMARVRFPDGLVVQDGLSPAPVDGSTKNVITLPQADALVPSVSAASIFAKVHRDSFMRAIATQFPHYGFESNVGYGAPAHRKGLKRHGVCAIHRRSYKPIKAFIMGVN